MLLDENLFEEENAKHTPWTHFTYKSGANPYVAKTSLEKNRILKKYRNSTRKTGDSSYEIDDTKENKDLFSVNEDASAKAYGKKLGSEDIQYYSLMNRFNYTIRQVRIDNNNKTYEIGEFNIPHRTSSTHNGAEFKRFIDSLKEKGYTEVKNSKDSLSESASSDASSDYVKYLKQMIRQEEDALANAKSEWVKATIEKRLKAFKQDLKDFTKGSDSVNHNDNNRVAYSIVVFADKNKSGEHVLTATPKNAFDYLYFDTVEQAQEYADKNYPNAEYVMIREDSWFGSDGYARVSGPYSERTNGTWSKHPNLRESLDRQSIESEIRKVIRNHFSTYSDEEYKDVIEDYLTVEIEETGKNTKVEVRAELSYKTMDKLADELNPIVQRYDKDAYFDHEDAGIINAYIRHAFKESCEDKAVNEAFNGGQTPGEFVWKMAQGFAKDNPELINKLRHKEKTIEEATEELYGQFSLITKELWEQILKAACLCYTGSVNESFEDEHGVESISEEQPQVEIPAQDPNNQDNGLIALVNSLIQDEFDAIQQYKDAITNFAANNKTELTTVLQDILDEENIHVGQLETLLKSLDTSAESIEQGKQEGQEQIELATDMANETVTEDLDKKEETKKCSICGKEFTGYGNNAYPINDGVCCDDCNTSEVIPARLNQMVKGDKK